MDHVVAQPSWAQEVIVIARREKEREREREEVIGVLTNGTAWRQSCGDGFMTVLNRGGWWCSGGEILEPRWVRWIMGVLPSRLL
jgi:hypothetical protein